MYELELHTPLIFVLVYLCTLAFIFLQVTVFLGIALSNPMKRRTPLYNEERKRMLKIIRGVLYCTSMYIHVNDSG